jgi:hypothetical protein
LRGLAFAALVSTCAFIAGCPSTEGGPSNGVDHILYFSDVIAGDFGAVPLSVTRTVTIKRFTSGTRVCEPSLSHGGGDCTGGATQDLVTLESARCESFECRVELGREGDTPVLRFSSMTAGKTRLRVEVKSTEDDETYSDAFEVRFAEAKRLALMQYDWVLVALAMPIYPGVKILRPFVEIQDVEGRTLKVDGGNPDVKVEGASLSQDRAYFEATSPGITKLTWELPGILSRSVDVEVIEPASESALVVSGPILLTSLNDANHVDFDEFLTRLNAPPPVVERSATSKSLIYHVVFAKFADGRRAVVPIDKAELAPTVGDAKAFISKDHPWTLELSPPGIAGDATLHLEARAAKTSVPVRFTP